MPVPPPDPQGGGGGGGGITAAQAKTALSGGGSNPITDLEAGTTVDGVPISTGLQGATVHLTGAQVVDLVANPVELVPAPGVGKVLIPEGFVTVEFVKDTDEYTGSIGVSWDNDPNLAIGSIGTFPMNSLTGNGSTVGFLSGAWIGNAENIIDIENTNIAACGTELNPNPGSGNGDFYISFSYKIYDLH